MQFLTDGLTFKSAERSAVVYGGLGLILGLIMSRDNHAGAQR